MSDLPPALAMSWGELEFERLVQLEVDARGTPHSRWHEDNGAEQIFGGQILAQTLLAAARTVADRRPAQILQLNFARSGRIHLPAEYGVEVTAEGRTIAGRKVVIRQRGKIVATANVGFQKPGQLLDDDVPPVAFDDEPERLLSLSELVGRHPPLRTGGGLAVLSQKASADFRFVDPDDYAVRKAPSRTGNRVWMRLSRRIGDDPLLHQAAVLYLTDYIMAYAPFLHVASVAEIQNWGLVTMNHNAWFYRPLRADDWLVADVERVAMVADRGLAIARVYTPQGALVAIVTQELLCLATEFSREKT